MYDLVVFETEEEVSHYLSLAGTEALVGELYGFGYIKGVFKKMFHEKKYGIYEGNYFYSLAVNHSGFLGASGSPVLNRKNEVIGIVFQASENILTVVKSYFLNQLMIENLASSWGFNCSQLTLQKCIEEELENLKKRAEEKDPIAQYALANSYLSGKGIPQNNKLAFYWCEKSAEEGNVLAQYNVALMYHFGKGTSQNHESAFYWFETAAKQGHIAAQYSLAMMYYDGKRTPQNFTLALHWFETAAKQGHVLALYNLAMMYYEGKGTIKNDELAFRFFKAATKQGYAPAENMLDAFYYDRQSPYPEANWLKKFTGFCQSVFYKMTKIR